MQQSPIKIGMNRTGARACRRERTRRTEQATQQRQPFAQPDGQAVAATARGIHAVDADPLGSVPPPAHSWASSRPASQSCPARIPKC